MRSIGRAEETKDEIIDHYVMLINKQQVGCLCWWIGSCTRDVYSSTYNDNTSFQFLMARGDELTVMDSVQPFITDGSLCFKSNDSGRNLYKL